MKTERYLLFATLIIALLFLAMSLGMYLCETAPVITKQETPAKVTESKGE